MQALARKILTRSAIAIVFIVSGCAKGQAPAVAVPRDGATEIALANHLPESFQITGVRLALDGDALPSKVVGMATNTTSVLFHARAPEGAHTLDIVAEVRVPCGLMAEPFEKLTLTISRSFTVGPNGGLVHIDAFAESPWLNPSERVHLLVSLRGLSEGRVLYGQSKDAKQACGRLGRLERSRCVVQRLTDRARAQRDVAGLLCEKDKLEVIDDAIASLDEPAPATDNGASASKAPLTADQRRREVETKVEQAERDAEYCVAEDVSRIGKQEVSSDRSACARYDEPLSLRGR